MVKTPEIHCHHHFEWSVILAASIVACAISAVLTQFGSIIGLSSDNFITDSVAMTHWTVIAVGLWILAIQLSASAVGGYMAGRLRTAAGDQTPHENEIRDGFYGLSVWAVSTVFVLIAVSVANGFMVSIEAADGTVDLTPELMEQERKAMVIFAFVVGASSMASAALAWAAATLGGDHRDKGTDYSERLTFRGR